MINQPETLFLFPTAIYKNKLNKDVFRKMFAGHLNDYDFVSTDDVLTGEILGKSNIHHIDQFKQFYQTISFNAKLYVQALGVDSNMFDPYITKSWLSIIDKQDYHMKFHSHTVADISFVYYLDVPENPDAICFNNTTLPNSLFPDMLNQERKNHFVKQLNPANFNSFYLVPEEGMLVMFPGKQVHGTIPHPSGNPQKGKRVAIVGDINLYLKPGLNEYETGRISIDHMRKFDDPV